MALDPQELRSRLRGIISFGITPFHDDYSLNLEALRRNAAEIAASSGVLVALGNNGEIFSLSPEEQKQVGQVVVEAVSGKKPVVIGVGFSLPVSCDLARAAESAGAAGVLALPPHYTNSTDDGLFEYYRAIPVYDLRGRRPGYQIVVIKEAMNLCGFPAGPVRPPLAPMTAADRNDLRAVLEGLGVVPCP